MKTKSIFVSVVLLLSLILTACGGAAKPVSGSFAGKVSGSDAFISIVLHANGEVTAYVCDSVAISEWFRGSVDGTTLDLTNASGAHLSADLSADSVTGTFTPADGSALTFSTSAVTQPAGLFRSEETVDGVKYVDGWIFLPDGDVRGARTGGGKITKATWVDPDVAPWIDPDVSP